MNLFHLENAKLPDPETPTPGRRIHAYTFGLLLGRSSGSFGLVSLSALDHLAGEFSGTLACPL